MAMTGRTFSILAGALSDRAAASELKTLLSSATGGVGTDPSVATITTSGAAVFGTSATVATTLTVGTTLGVTGAATFSNDVKIASGHTLKVNNISVVGAQQTAVTPIAITWSANTPATYASPTGALTISDGSVPTVVELVKYCNELRKNIVDLQAVLHAHGLTT